MRLKSVGDLQSDFDERFQIWSPSFLLRERDVSYGSVFSKRVAAMGITEVVTASRSPWQNACVERVIGSIRRECLDHVVICNERHFAACSFVLRRLLPSNEDAELQELAVDAGRTPQRVGSVHLPDQITNLAIY
jgi:hypothetical protein